MVVPTLSTTPLSDEDSVEDTTELDCVIEVCVQCVVLEMVGGWQMRL